MQTIKLKSMRSGGYAPAHPGAKVGVATMTYAITNVPNEIGPAAVARLISKITLAHSINDPRGWTYDWPELADKPLGTIINRYRQASEAARAAKLH